MSGFDDLFKRGWKVGRKLDPLGSRALEAIVKMDSKGVREVARGLGKATGGEGSWLGRRFNDLGDEADKNVNDPARGIGRAAATVGLLYGGAALAGAGGGAAAGGAAAEGGGGLYSGLSGLAGETGGAAAAGGGGLYSGLSGLTADAGGTAAAGGVAGGGTFIPGADSAAWSASQGYAPTTGGVPSTVNIVNGGGSQATGGGGFSPQFQRLLSMRQQMPQPQQEPIRDVEVEDNPYIRELSLSSKKAKKPARSVEQAIQRGAKRENPIDTTGVQMASIKVLNQRFARIEQAMRRRSA